jgi:hypothetical protein
MAKKSKKGKPAPAARSVAARHEELVAALQAFVAEAHASGKRDHPHVVKAVEVLNKGSDSGE